MNLAGAPKSPATPFKSCLTYNMMTTTTKKTTTNLPVIKGEEHFGAEYEENQCHSSWLTNTPGASLSSIHKSEAAATAD